MTGEEEGLFTGTVNGKKGTFAFTAVINGQFISETRGGMTSRLTIVNGTDELTKLRGEINVNIYIDATATKGTYSGILSFEGVQD